MYNNPNGFRSSAWGPHAWYFLHFVAHNYTVSKREAYRRFFVSLGDVLPCKFCRENYKRKIAMTMTPEVFSSRRALAKWVFDLHNMVNVSLNKPKFRGFDMYARFLERYRAV